MAILLRASIALVHRPAAARGIHAAFAVLALLLVWKALPEARGRELG